MMKGLAEDLAYLLRNCTGLLEHTAWLSRQYTTEEEFLKYRGAVAQVLAELRTQLLAPIFAEYPELDPSSPAYAGGQGGQYPGGAHLGERSTRRADGERGGRGGAGLDKELAAHLNYFLPHCSCLLLSTLPLVEHHETEEEYQKYRKAVGWALAEIGFQISYYIGDKYPEIDYLSPKYIGDRAIYEGSYMSEHPKDEPEADRIS